MKKILVVTGTLDFGGVQRLVLDTARTLARSGAYRPIVLNLSGEGELQRELVHSGIEHISLGKTSLQKNIVANLIRMRKLIKACRPDIIHTHQFASDFYGSVGAFGLGIPVISHIHNIDVEYLSRRIIRSILNRFFINGLIATTEEKFEELQRAFPRKKVFLLFNAIDPENLTLPKNFTREDFRTQFSIPKNDFIVGAAGRLSWEKGYDLLLPAFKQALGEVPNASLMLVGGGPEEKKLKDLAEELGIADKVIFTGYREDIAALFSIFDIFVISSRLESFSLVALEAMLMGIPVIITDQLKSRELFKPAVLTAPFSLAGMSAGIVALLKNAGERARLSLAGKKLAGSRFTMGAYRTELESIYRQMLEENS